MSLETAGARWELLHDDCRAALLWLPSESVHAVVCDPPYELGFMGKKWDASGIAYDAAMWGQVLRVLKPGGHLLAFGGTRTYHRMACAIEDAGFEIRDCMQWLYASGFPKSLNISKAIDAANGDTETRKIVSSYTAGGNAGTSTKDKGGTYVVGAPNSPAVTLHNTRGATPESQAWDGWGTALKPACEPIVVARKALSGTVAANVLAHGTGGINVDGCRIAAEAATGWGGGRSALYEGGLSRVGGDARWPANVMHDGSPEVLEAFARFGERASGASVGNGGKIFGSGGGPTHDGYAGDSGTAARFFFCAKASRAERELGCGGLAAKTGAQAVDRADGSAGQQNPRAGAGRTANAVRNYHPTVKPLALMRYLCRLVTPPNGIVLDPFAGSGTCGMAALLEGFRYLGIELDAAHIAIARARISHPVTSDARAGDGDAAKQLGLFGAA